MTGGGGIEILEGRRGHPRVKSQSVGLLISSGQPADAGRWSVGVLMMDQRRRSTSTIKTALGESFVLSDFLSNVV